ncbi:MAG: HAD-IIB family hydrolase [Sedimenticola sp.]
MYLLLISIHGLIRGHDLELGRDADTGGQTKYVVDLARALAQRDDVARVDLVTRRVVDPDVHDDYALPVEELSEKARIVRIDAGPEGYIAKEALWDHLDSFMDNLLNWLNSQPQMPDLVHSHYADAGYVAVKLSNLIGVPLVHTGHSLGRDKRQRLLAKGLEQEEINLRYNMDRRVDAEEEVLANADLVITSTHNEIEEQYGLYNHYRPDSMVVIPPGTDLSQFHPPGPGDTDPEFSQTIGRFLEEPRKPMVLALSRPDERKNILALIEAYGESPELQERANLVIVAGTRDDIREMDRGPQTVLKSMLLLIDLYDLYGKVAIPKQHRPEEVEQIYRLAANSRGVFINPALTEPFGLTLLEAAASGLPLVATENGGPVDIIGNCNNGLLIDPLDKEAMVGAMLSILEDLECWQRFSLNGLEKVREQYSWEAHAKSYMKRIMQLPKGYKPIPEAQPAKRPMRYRDRAIFTDLDQNLLGNLEGLQQFNSMVKDNRKCGTFGIATGRRLDSALAVLKKHGIPRPDVLITSLGTEIHYGQKLTADDFWAEHIDHLWKPLSVRRLLDDLPGMEPQRKSEQSRFKIAYHFDEAEAPPVEEINDLLHKRDLTCNVIHAFGQYLDIVPVRASKGQALRYVAQRWGIPLENILVAGGSGADEDMMRGNTMAVVVANRHHEELSKLVDQERIYFAKEAHALGIIEALNHYDFFKSCEISGSGAS